MREKVGLVRETNRAYHGTKDAVSKSQLARMSVCPKYFKWCEDNPPEQTEAMLVGSAFHKLCLEAKTFDKEFVILPPIDRRTKAGKELYANFVAEAEEKGHSVLTPEQYQTACKMRDSLMGEKYAVELLKGVHERSIYTADDFTGERIKVRPDCYKIIENGDNKMLLITDIKSCVCAREEDFRKDVVKFHYDLQAFMYSFAASKVLDIPIEHTTFLFIAVEKKPPYLIHVLVADDNIMHRGEALFREYIGMYHEAKTANNWWGYNGKDGEISTLSLPNYLIKN